MEEKVYVIVGGEWKESEIISSMEIQFKQLYPNRKLECIEVEWEEDNEIHFNIVADGGNYFAVLNEDTSRIYWDKHLG